MKIDELAKIFLNDDVIPITITSITAEVDTHEVQYRGVVSTVPIPTYERRKFEAVIKSNQDIDIESKYVLLKVSE